MQLKCKQFQGYYTHISVSGHAFPIKSFDDVPYLKILQHHNTTIMPGSGYQNI